MEKNDVLHKNLNALEASLPELYKWIESCLHKTQKTERERKIVVESEMGVQGDSVVVVRKGNCSYYLNGKYNPEAMAERQASRMENMGYESLVFVVGISDGRVLRKLTEKLDEDAFIFVYEPLEEVFLHTLANYDLSSLFQRRHIALIVEGINGKALKDALEYSIVVDRGDKIQALVLGNYENICFEEVKESLELLKKSVEMMMIQWRTMMLNMHVSVENCIRNMRYLGYHFSLDALYGILPPNVPVIVVAAGPSLDKNIHLLTNAKGKACIIACDTALKPLLSRGIIPDFFAVLDPRKPMELFDASGVMEIPMISGLNVPDKIMRKHTGKKFFSLDFNLIKALNQEVFGKDFQNREYRMSPVSCGGSVATYAFSVGRLLGTATIILVGQDLAIDGNKSHASGTFSKDPNYEHVISKLPKVEGIAGGMVPTLENLKLYLEWFENEIEQYPCLQVIDATEGGALIHGSKVMSLEMAIDKYCTAEIHLDKQIEKLSPYFDDVQRQKAYEFIADLPEKLMKICKTIQAGENAYQDLEKIVTRKNCKAQSLQKLLKRIRKINRDLDREELVDLLFQGMRNEEYFLRVSIFEFQKDKEQDLLETAKKGQKLMKLLHEKADQLKPELENLVQETPLKGSTN